MWSHYIPSRYCGRDSTQSWLLGNRYEVAAADGVSDPCWIPPPTPECQCVPVCVDRSVGGSARWGGGKKFSFHWPALCSLIPAFVCFSHPHGHISAQTPRSPFWLRYPKVLRDSVVCVGLLVEWFSISAPPFYRLVNLPMWPNNLKPRLPSGFLSPVPLFRNGHLAYGQTPSTRRAELLLNSLSDPRQNILLSVWTSPRTSSDSCALRSLKQRKPPRFSFCKVEFQIIILVLFFLISKPRPFPKQHQSGKDLRTFLPKKNVIF